MGAGAETALFHLSQRSSSRQSSYLPESSRDCCAVCFVLFLILFSPRVPGHLSLSVKDDYAKFKSSSFIH